jgi:hypothetical protein
MNVSRLDYKPRATDMLALRPRKRNASLCTLTDKVALTFSHGSNHTKHEFARRCAQVERFLERDESHADRFEFCESLLVRQGPLLRRSHD